MIIAAIDIGSNALRLLIQDIHTLRGEVTSEKISLTRVPVRLGEDVFLKGRISREKMLQLANAMKAFWCLMDVHKVEYFRACATSAMREAKNQKEIIQTIHEKSHIHIDILSGDEEAELIFRNYEKNRISEKDHLVYIDVGGGSTEVSFISPDGESVRKSFNLGTVRSLHLGQDRKEWQRAEKWLISHKPKGVKLTGIGTGGNINTVFKLLGKKPHDKISVSEIRVLNSQLEKLEYRERMTRYKLKPDRADVIVPACQIYYRLMKTAGIREMKVPKIGLPDGIIRHIYDTVKVAKSDEQKSEKPN
jgi:exopolyphosphatase/guanosine-5'-triphosphate,3'-diphosphate pyrophosphatase